MSSPLAICNDRTPAAAKVVARLAGRLAALEKLDSATYRSRVKTLFGKVLPPREVVERILADVQKAGDTAVCRYTLRLDGAKLTPNKLRVTRREMEAAYRATPKKVRDALILAARRIAAYQRRILPRDVATAPGSLRARGVRTGLKWTSIQRVGIYVPGGTAPLFSSVLMNAIPAQVAGVREIAVATPCGRDGRVGDGILCACQVLGLKEVYRIGGAQAIGALAYGTATVPAVQKIAGPGNLFVMLAKRAVFGRVDIDMLAGPSEVLIVADRSARADWVAADLLAQAEHDPLSSCVLLTDSAAFARKVQAEVDLQLNALPRREIAAAALRDWGAIVVVRNMRRAVELANELAPEHLEIMTRRPEALARRLTTAGAIFLGAHATEPLGDYLAGPSHTLPTGGTARAFSGVSVYTFLRRTSLIAANAQGLEELAEATEALAEAEGLEAHRRAVALRRNRENGPFSQMAKFRAALVKQGAKVSKNTVNTMRKEERE